MCLFVASGPYIAQERKLVYKVLRKERYGNGKERLVSPYRDYVYRPYTVHEASLRPRKELHYTGHAFKRGQAIHRGLHACTYVGSAKRLMADLGEGVCVRAYIPKGATYYLGDNGDIVSNILMVLDTKPEVDRG